MSITVDQNGNINALALEKELQSALEFDLKYKQTDSMKKRAIKTAGTYDEFKNMVACAHLKTVSREEVESLRAIKKGWQKKKEQAPETLVLEREMNAASSDSISAAAIKPKKMKRPKTSMDFDRDWRRMKTSEDKIRYLNFVGLVRSSKILKCDMSAELMEDIISVILPPNAQTYNPHDVTTQTSDENGECVPVLDSDPYSWLKVFSEFDRFSLNIRFLREDIISRVVEWLRNRSEDDVAVVVTRFLIP